MDFDRSIENRDIHVKKRLQRIQGILHLLEEPKTARQLAEELKTWPTNIHRDINVMHGLGWLEVDGVNHARWRKGKSSKRWKRKVRLVEVMV